MIWFRLRWEHLHVKKLKRERINWKKYVQQIRQPNINLTKTVFRNNWQNDDHLNRRTGALQRREVYNEGVLNCTCAEKYSFHWVYRHMDQWGFDRRKKHIEVGFWEIEWRGYLQTVDSLKTTKTQWGTWAGISWKLEALPLVAQW